MITHQHIDHLGLVEIVAAHSGAEVAAIDAVVAVRRELRRRRRARRRVRRRAHAPLRDPRRHGHRAAQRLGQLPRLGRRGRRSPARSHDGELLELRDRTLEVQHRPGHSPSDTLFWDAERRILICADHLIAHISSNPLLSRPLDGSDERPQALVTYLRVARAHPRAARRDPAAGPRRADHRPRRADRRALRHAPAPRREARRPDRRAAAHRATSWRRSCGATSPSPRPS